MNQGVAEARAAHYSRMAYDYFNERICNSRDPFKDCCDYAGKMAESDILKFKYKSPKAKSTARAKKPQEAFNFE